MIIDEILDRKKTNKYDTADFYYYCLQSGTEVGKTISEVMDYANDDEVNDQVRKILCKYIDDNEYNPEIKKYINSVDWV